MQKSDLIKIYIFELPLPALWMRLKLPSRHGLVVVTAK